MKSKILSLFILLTLCACTNGGGGNDDPKTEIKLSTIVLNEGSFSAGTMTLIKADDNVTDSAFYRANGSLLPKTAQNMAYKDGKIYIVSQIVGITIVSSENLVQESFFSDPNNLLNLPTHIAVTDEKTIYVRDSKGVWIYNNINGSLAKVASVPSPKLTAMATYKNYLYVISGKSLYQVSAKDLENPKKVEFTSALSGVVVTGDDLYVSCKQDKSNTAKFVKINPETLAVIKENNVEASDISEGWGATSAFAAKGDTLYFNNASTTVYRHIFSTGNTQLMIDVKTDIAEAQMAYNNVAVNPESGEVYLTTIKGYGQDYLINDIIKMNLKGNKGSIIKSYKNYTRFPSGVFFVPQTYTIEK